MKQSKKKTINSKIYYIAGMVISALSTLFSLFSSLSMGCDLEYWFIQNPKTGLSDFENLCIQLFKESILFSQIMLVISILFFVLFFKLLRTTKYCQ